MNTNSCPVKDCGAIIDRQKAFCRRHWSRLTNEQRAAVYDSYRLFVRGVRSYSKHFKLIDRIARELTQPSLEL